VLKAWSAPNNVLPRQHLACQLFRDYLFRNCLEVGLGGEDCTTFAHVTFGWPGLAESSTDAKWRRWGNGNTAVSDRLTAASRSGLLRRVNHTGVDCSHTGVGDLP
jgi:hypothetical protein